MTQSPPARMKAALVARLSFPMQRSSSTRRSRVKGVPALFKLPLRQTAGMVSSLLRMAGLDWPAPDYSTLRRRL